MDGDRPNSPSPGGATDRSPRRKPWAMDRDRPADDRGKARIHRPFTVAAVPAAVFGKPILRSIDPIDKEAVESAARTDSAGAPHEMLRGARPTLEPSIARHGETLRQSEWR